MLKLVSAKKCFLNFREQTFFNNYARFLIEITLRFPKLIQATLAVSQMPKLFNVYKKIKKLLKYMNTANDRRINQNLSSVSRKTIFGIKLSENILKFEHIRCKCKRVVDFSKFDL